MRAIDGAFKGGRVDLDGNEFIRCRFENSTLVYSGTAPTTLNDCVFVGVTFELAGPAALTMAFLAGMYRGGGEGGRALVESLFNSIRQAQPQASAVGVAASTGTAALTTQAVAR